MPKMLLSPKRLSRGLVTQRFTLCRSCTVTKEIGFSRLSSIPRLFEQLRVCGQGQLGEAVYAMTTVSATPNWINDDCIAIVDRNLMFVLENDVDRHWTVLADTDDAQRWESQLIHLADEACIKTADEHGPSLIARLDSEFATLDRYIDHLGDMRSILDAEFSFIENADDRERRLVDFWSIGKSEDWNLACHVLIRYAPKLATTSTPTFDLKLHECARLRALLYLLADHVAACRSQYSIP